jgi:hypothetical protein
VSGDDTYKFQVSQKYGAGGTGMLNVRADDAQELADNVTAAVAVVGPAAVLAEALNTEFQAIANMVQAFPQATAAPAQQAQPQQASAGELCQHGAMQFKSGNGANGPWSGWFCPTQKDDPTKCKPKFLPKGR